MFEFIDLFAGIGGFRTAAQMAGGRCVFSCEWDKFARTTYSANFGGVPAGDIRLVPASSIPDHDVLLAGFPCQPFSISGISKKKSLGRATGFMDQTQGTLFFEVARIIGEKLPKAVVLENVKNLLHHDKGQTFAVIKGALEEHGYKVFHKVLNASAVVPQNRERIFIVALREGYFEFPELADKHPQLKDILEPEVADKYTLSDSMWQCLLKHAERHKKKGNGFGYGLANISGISRTLQARYYKDGSEILIPQAGKNPRRLTPRECARLMGFPDSFVIPVSDTRAYKQFGNSVVVPVVFEVLKAVVAEMSNPSEFVWNPICA
jgi:DNA (cytosine-5)-methyltransferase 1